MTGHTHWTYRVMVKNDDGGWHRGIHEVYFNDDGDPWAWTEKGVAPVFCSADGEDWSLKQEMERMLLALDLPELDFKTGKEIKLP